MSVAACSTQDFRRSAGTPQSVMALSATSTGEHGSPSSELGDLRRAEESIADLESQIFSATTSSEIADVIFPVGPPQGGSYGEVSHNYKDM